MRSIRTTSTATTMTLALMMGAALAAEPAKVSKELVIGEYACSTFPAYGPRTQGWLVATTTTGLFAAGTTTAPVNILVTLEAAGVPACDHFASDAKRRIETASGCTASAISAVDPDPGNTSARRSVQFYCTGQRDQMVDSLARLVDLIVTSAR